MLEAEASSTEAEMVEREMIFGMVGRGYRGDHYGRVRSYRAQEGRFGIARRKKVRIQCGRKSLGDFDEMVEQRGRGPTQFPQIAEYMELIVRLDSKMDDDEHEWTFFATCACD